MLKNVKKFSIIFTPVYNNNNDNFHLFSLLRVWFRVSRTSRIISRKWWISSCRLTIKSSISSKTYLTFSPILISRLLSKPSTSRQTTKCLSSTSPPWSGTYGCAMRMYVEGIYIGSVVAKCKCVLMGSLETVILTLNSHYDSGLSKATFAFHQGPKLKNENV